MSKETRRPKPRIYKGFRDLFADEIAARNAMINQIKQVYENYGFMPLETPSIEYVDILGKFLPESNQVDEGIFSLLNEDKEWIALRYDLTAPLSRVTAQYQDIPKPYRRYQLGMVYRMEKPGPGRYREFMQFDFDTVGASGTLADSEVCCIMADTIEAVGIQKGEYIVRVNNRKVLQGVLYSMGISDEKIGGEVLRSVDKLDKIGLEGVKLLLTKGRKDPSGDFTAGLGLGEAEVAKIESFLNTRATTRSEVCNLLEGVVGASDIGLEGINELRQMDEQLKALGYDEDRIIFDPTVVRGMGYYTGAVYEAELTVPMVDENGETKTFGTIFGGGRYDDLVERFTGQKVPAVGASIGIDRLLAALKHVNRLKTKANAPQVLVTTMDKNLLSEYQLVAQKLRRAGFRTELFIGKGNIGKQLKYADSKNIPIALIMGDEELKNNKIQVKDLWLGLELAENITDREEWRTERPAQFEIELDQLENEIKNILKRYKQIV